MSSLPPAAVGRVPRFLPHLGRCLDVLQLVVGGAALLLCFRLSAPARTWVLLGLTLPAIRWAVSSAYRERVRRWLVALGQQFAAYPGGGAFPWRASAVLVVAPALIFLSLGTEPLMGGDTQPVVLMASRLVAHGDVDLSEYAGDYHDPGFYHPGEDLPYFLTRTRSGIHSHHAAGMVAFALPVAAVARLAGADFTQSAVRARLERWASCWVAALALALFHLVALHLAAPRPAWGMTALLATGSALYTTVGHLLWPHGGVIVCGLLLLLVEFRRVRRPSWLDCWLQGLACALMLACRPASVVFVVPFGTWVLLREPRRAFAIAGIAVLGWLPWVLFYESLYGTAIGPSSGQLGRNNWSVPRPLTVAAVLVSPARGLLVYQPWILVGLAGLVPALRRLRGRGPGTAPAGWAVFCGVVIVLHLAVVCSWWGWDGGACWGSRLPSEIVPLCGLLCVGPLAALGELAAGRLLIGLVAVLGLLVHVPYAHFHACRWDSRHLERRPDRVWSWSDAPFLYPLRHGR
jgi:hypothetical protein